MKISKEIPQKERKGIKVDDELSKWKVQFGAAVITTRLRFILAYIVADKHCKNQWSESKQQLHKTSSVITMLIL